MARIAGIACPCCGQPDASVSKSKGGALNVKCHRCDFSGYAQPGTRAARQIEAKMRPDDDDAAPARAAPPQPAARKPSGLLIEG